MLMAATACVNWAEKFGSKTVLAGARPISSAAV
jgi:hypothetical protein